MDRRIETFSAVLAIGFLVALLASTLQRLGQTWALSVSYSGITIVALIVKVGVGYWLYQKAKRRNQYPWLWCLLGFVFGLVAVATYYIIEIHRIVATPKQYERET